MNSRELFRSLISQITIDESPEEIQEIVYFLIEKVTGLKKSDVLAGNEVEERNWTDEISRINNFEPVQYVAGRCDFFGREFAVNKNVLIPRPETEQLVEHAITFARKNFGSQCSIADIGTGSGCIAITLALELPESNVWASDISEGALHVAMANAKKLKATVEFTKQDILFEKPTFNNVDMLISNPPYIREAEKSSMSRNIVGHEPSGALFVPDDDPLLFYNAITAKAKKILNKRGVVFVEINEALGADTAKVFEVHGFRKVSVLKDIHNKDRYVLALQ